MGRRGPKKKPVELEKLAGRPGRRPLANVVEMPAGTRPPRRPAWLTAKGKTLWATLAPALWSAELLKAVDAPMLAILCQVWSDWRDARGEVKRKGRHFTMLTGYRAVTPEYVIERQLRMDFIRIAAEFGMSPSGRTGLAWKGEDKGGVIVRWLEQSMKVKAERAAAMAVRRAEVEKGRAGKN